MVEAVDSTAGAAGEGRAGLVGQVVEATVERIVPGGAGLAHGSGRTLFVERAAPGDRVRVRIERERGNVCFGEIVEVLAAAPDRIAPPCPFYGSCGGCDFQHLSDAAQIAAKAGIVRDCLRRIGGIEPPAEIPIIPSPRPWGYRTTAEWQHDARAGALGYFAAASHDVCDVGECAVLAPELAARLAGLRRQRATGDLPAGVTEFRAVAGDAATALLPPLAPDDAAELICTVAGERYRYDAGSFFQANRDLLPALVDEALRSAAPDDASANGLALDLYCGVGLFTLPLARRFARVIGVEAHRGAARYAVRNLRDAGLTNTRIEPVAVARWLATHAAGLAPAEFVLLDPPRTGAGAETMAGILALRPAHVAYVACDPATLARDLRPLLAGGYRLTRVAALDMFPQTHHVETVAHLELIAGG